MPALLGVALLGAFAVAAGLTTRAGLAARRVPTWGCGGELTARTEYTATAFSKPLDHDLPRRVPADAGGGSAGGSLALLSTRGALSADIEPTFERYVYGPLLRAVLRMADGMKVLQAGSLHAYLAYVLVLGVVLLLWLGGTT